MFIRTPDWWFKTDSKFFTEINIWVDHLSVQQFATHLRLLSFTKNVWLYLLLPVCILLWNASRFPDPDRNLDDKKIDPITVWSLQLKFSFGFLLFILVWVQSHVCFVERKHCRVIKHQLNLTCVNHAVSLDGKVAFAAVNGTKTLLLSAYMEHRKQKKVSEVNTS